MIFVTNQIITVIQLFSLTYITDTETKFCKEIGKYYPTGTIENRKTFSKSLRMYTSGDISAKLFDNKELCMKISHVLLSL